MLLHVETHPGHAGTAEPEAFWLGNRRVPVRQIIDRWPATDYIYFKVLAEDDATYILRHDDNDGTWELTMFHAPGQ